MAKYICKKCGFTYDENAASEEIFFEEINGQLEEGVIDTEESAEVFMEEINGVLAEGLIDHSEKCKALGFFPGTKWRDVPGIFKCPQCNARKDEFKTVSGF